MTEPAEALPAPRSVGPSRGAWKVAVPCLLVYRSLGQFALPDGALEVLGCEPPTEGAAAAGLAAVMSVPSLRLATTTGTRSHREGTTDR